MRRRRRRTNLTTRSSARDPQGVPQADEWHRRGVETGRSRAILPGIEVDLTPQLPHVDSSEIAFRCRLEAFHDRQARPPGAHGTVIELVTPLEYLGDVIGDITSLLVRIPSRRPAQRSLTPASAASEMFATRRARRSLMAVPTTA